MKPWIGAVVCAAAPRTLRGVWGDISPGPADSSTSPTRTLEAVVPSTSPERYGGVSERYSGAPIAAPPNIRPSSAGFEDGSVIRYELATTLAGPCSGWALSSATRVRSTTIFE